MKSFKRIWMTLIIMALTVAMVIGTMSFTAFGLNTSSSENYLSGVNIVSKVVYGKEFDVPNGENGVTVKVKAPNGAEVTPVGGKVKAQQVGTYTVSYSKAFNEKDYTYDFQVYSYVEEDYSIKVELGGANIPTYLAAGNSFTLPKADLVYYDEDGKEIKAEGVTVYTKTSLSATPVAADGKGVVSDVPAGNLYVTYYAQLGGEGGMKYYSKDFTVTVQDTFTDTTVPTLNVVNVPTDANINKKVTLPKATAKDNFDENIAIKVEVKLGDTPVAEVDVDDNGFAVVKEGAAAVEFDNDKVMSFYPTAEGKYQVTYQATDDAGKQSALHTYTIVCSDKSAPTFKNVDEYKIPSAWGLGVTGANGALEDATLTFPVPEVIDNAGTDGMTIGFKILDSESKTVISFNNILADENSDDFKYKGSASTYGTEGTEYKFSAPFDFNKVNTGNKTGDYTVEYRAKDKKGNISTKTYKIAVTTDFEDKDAPEQTKIVDAPEYMVIAPDEDKFTVPAIEATDKGTSRPNIDYKMTSAADPDVALNLKGGETLDVETVDSDTFLVLDSTKRIKIAGGRDITLSLTVTDSVGNSKSDSKTVKVFSADAANHSLSLNMSGIKYEQAGDDALGSKSFKTGVAAELGGFEINVGDAKFRYFTGYELSVKNTAGDNYVEVTSEVYYNTAANKIVVRGIEFTPNKVGVYQLSVRAFDLSGKSIVGVALINVEQGSGSGVDTSAEIIPAVSGSINVKYKFKNTSYTIPGGTGTYYMSHRVTGGKYAVMGNEMTVYQAGSYTVNDGYVKYDETSGAGAMNLQDSYVCNFKDDASPIVEIQGTMPTYSQKSTDEQKVEVKLPSMIAYSKNGGGTVDVTVRLVDGGSIGTKYNEADGTYSFEPTSDGQYKITVTGTVGSAVSSNDYFMSAGDVKGPKFEVTGLFEDRVIVGKEFTFGVINATADTGENVEKFKYTKRLIDPSKEVVTSATIEGTGTTYANKTKQSDDATITLSKTGTYEVEYVVTDQVGNKTTFKQTIVVTSKTGVSSVSIAAISTILIIVGVLLIAGVILYFVLFRKRKEKKVNA